MQYIVPTLARNERSLKYVLIVYPENLIITKFKFVKIANQTTASLCDLIVDSHVDSHDSLARTLSSLSCYSYVKTG